MPTPGAEVPLLILIREVEPKQQSPIAELTVAPERLQEAALIRQEKTALMVTHPPQEVQDLTDR